MKKQIYNYSLEELAAELGTDLESGLSSAEVAKRLERDGFNEIEYYEAVRDSSLRGLQQLERDSGNLERIAREKYGMHLPDEEVFIIK